MLFGSESRSERWGTWTAIWSLFCQGPSPFILKKSGCVSRGTCSLGNVKPWSNRSGGASPSATQNSHPSVVIGFTHLRTAEALPASRRRAVRSATLRYWARALLHGHQLSAHGHCYSIAFGEMLLIRPFADGQTVCPIHYAAKPEFRVSSMKLTAQACWQSHECTPSNLRLNHLPQL